MYFYAFKYILFFGLMPTVKTFVSVWTLLLSQVIHFIRIWMMTKVHQMGNLL